MTTDRTFAGFARRIVAVPRLAALLLVVSFAS
jgi:hypothetical protein